MTVTPEHTPIIDADTAIPTSGGPGAGGPTRGDRARLAGYRNRFGGIFLLLAIIGGGAMGALIVGLLRDEAAPPAPWSARAPSGSAAKKLRWIAHNVGIRYRFPDGQQLVAAVATRPSLPVTEARPPANLSLIAIVERADYSRGDFEDDDRIVYDPQANAQFVLCGLGENCAFSPEAGPATQERFLLLAREGVELALYTFRYIREIETVTVFMPPPPGQDQGTGTTLFLTRGAVRSFTSKPLTSTLGQRTPSVGQVPTWERQQLDDITGGRFFEYVFRQTQDNGWLLALNPLGNTIP